MKKLNLIVIIMLAISSAGRTQDSIHALSDGPDYPDDKKTEIYPSAILSRHPLFPGGNVALEKWCAAHSRFTQSMADSGNIGKIFCQITIDSSGKPSHPQIVSPGQSPSNPRLAAETMRLVSQFPVFMPGQFRGKNVATKYFFVFCYLQDTTGMQTRLNHSSGTIPIFPRARP